MPGYHAGYFRTSMMTMEIDPQVAGAAKSGVGVDMNGWDGVAFMLIAGTREAANVLDARVVESANANFSGQVNIAGAAAVQLPNTQPNVIVTIDVFRPVNRYVRLVATPATNNASIGAVAVRYRAQGRTPLDLPTNSQYVAVAAQ